MSVSCFLNALGWESLFRLAFCKSLGTETSLQMWRNCAENPMILIIPNMRKCFWRSVLELIWVLRLGHPMFAKCLLCARHCSGRGGTKRNKTRAPNWLVRPTFLACSDVGGKFFIRKFMWEFRCKASILLSSEEASEVISVGFHFSFDCLTVLKANRRNSICQRVTWDFRLWLLIDIRDEAGFYFSYCPPGKFPAIVVLIIYSCNLESIRRGSKGLFLVY